MRQYKAEGHTSKEVARKYGVSECYARSVIRRDIIKKIMGSGILLGKMGKSF